MSAVGLTTNNTKLFNDSAGVTVIEVSDSRIFDVDTATFNESFLIDKDVIANICRAYTSHPVSFLVGLVLIMINLSNLVVYLSLSIYFIHPVLSLGLMICGLGMFSTMYLANK